MLSFGVLVGATRVILLFPSDYSPVVINYWSPPAAWASIPTGGDGDRSRAWGTQTRHKDRWAPPPNRPDGWNTWVTFVISPANPLNNAGDNVASGSRI